MTPTMQARAVSPTLAARADSWRDAAQHLEVQGAIDLPYESIQDFAHQVAESMRRIADVILKDEESCEVKK